jgi:L-serine dehydratase
LKTIRKDKALLLNGQARIAFAEKTDVLFLRRETLSFHPNGVKFLAFDAEGVQLDERRYFSVGGGFVVSQEDADADHAATQQAPRIVADATVLPHPFHSGDELLAITAATGTLT